MTWDDPNNNICLPFIPAYPARGGVGTSLNTWKTGITLGCIMDFKAGI